MEIFLDDTDYRQFVRELATVVHVYDIECWNYCIMPNHFHATLRPRLPNISKALQHLNGKYAQWWNRRHDRVGHVLQGRPKIQIVQDDAYAMALTRYVALNPVRAGLVAGPEQWRWSSFVDTAGLRQAAPFVATACTLRMFGDADEAMLRTRFLQFVTDGCDSTEMDEQFRSKDLIVGDGEFRLRVLAACGALPGTGGPAAPEAARQLRPSVATL